jgi:exopolyphosphatase/pppGpp-phosphohydrolase
MHQQLEASRQDEPTSEQRFADWQRWADEATMAAKVKQDQRRWAVGLSPGLRAGWKAWLKKVRQDPTVKRTKHLTPELLAELQQLEASKQDEQNERARRQPPTD